MDQNELTEIFKDLIEYMDKEYMKLYPLPKIFISKSDKYVSDILGPTGYYDPSTKKIVIYIEGRHPIDICKTLIHELVHHNQRLTNKLSPEMEKHLTEPDYMEKYPELLEMEAEAYLYSGIIFRTYRDAKRMKTGLH